MKGVGGLAPDELARFRAWYEQSTPPSSTPRSSAARATERSTASSRNPKQTSAPDASARSDLADQPVVLFMRADPMPMEVVARFRGERAIMRTDPHAPILSDLLKVKRRMARVAFQHCEILVGKAADVDTQRAIGGPKRIAGENASWRRGDVAHRPSSRAKLRQTACKPGSVPASKSGRWPFLWDVRCRTPRATDPDGDPKDRSCAVPIWSCSRWGLPCRSRCRARGALLPHHFNLAGPLGLRRCHFCGAVPGVAPGGCYPSPCPSWSPGLSSPPSQKERPSGHLTHRHYASACATPASACSVVVSNSGTSASSAFTRIGISVQPRITPSAPRETRLFHHPAMGGARRVEEFPAHQLLDDDAVDLAGGRPPPAPGCRRRTSRAGGRR